MEEPQIDTHESSDYLCPACGLPSSPEIECPHCHRLPVPATSHTDNSPTGWKACGDSYTITHYWFKNLYILGSGGVFCTIGVLLGVNYIRTMNQWTLINLGIGLGFFLSSYLGIALLFNRTRIKANSIEIDVRRGPFWLPLIDSYFTRSDQIGRWDAYREASSEGEDTFGVRLVTTNNEMYDVLSLGKEDQALQFAAFLNAILPPANQEVFKARLSAEPGKVLDPEAWKISNRYYIAIMSLFVLDIPGTLTLVFWVPPRFDFVLGILSFAITLGLWAIFYFHHRKHLSIWDSKPKREGQLEVGPVGYFIISLLMIGLWSPIVILLRAMLPF